MTAGAGPDHLVLITEELDREPEAWLAERCAVERISSAAPGFGERVREADGLIVRTYTQVDGALLDAAPRLKVVARAGVGLDNIDVPACRSRGVEVVYAPGANTRAVVEFVLASMLDALRPRERVTGALPLAEWKKLRSSLGAPVQLAGATLGIIGLGRIGKQVARAASAIDMRVIYTDVSEIPGGERFGAKPVEIEALASSSDVVTVHVDGRASNRGLIGAAFLDRMKAGAVLINSSRGMVVDPVACAAWLARDPGARAMLDVHDPEPIAPDSPLLGVANAVLTPHIAGGTRAAKLGMSWVVRDVWRVLRGEVPEHAAPSDA